MYLTGFSVKWCEVVQSGVNIRLVVIFTYGRTLGWSQNPLPVGQRLKTVYLSTFLPFYLSTFLPFYLSTPGQSGRTGGLKKGLKEGA